MRIWCACAVYVQTCGSKGSVQPWDWQFIGIAESLAWMESLYNFSGTELDWLLSQCYAAHTHHLSQQLCCCVAFNMKLWTQKLSTSIVFTLKSSVMHISIPFSPSHPFLLPLLKNPQGWQPCTNMAPFRYYIYSSNGSLRWVQYIFSSNASYVHSLSSCE